VISHFLDCRVFSVAIDNEVFKSLFIHVKTFLPFVHAGGGKAGRLFTSGFLLIRTLICSLGKTSFLPPRRKKLPQLWSYSREAVLLALWPGKPGDP
jgi:hypothetical protein